MEYKVKDQVVLTIEGKLYLGLVVGLGEDDEPVIKVIREINVN